MKNKKWKRQAKRLKGLSDDWCECQFCKLNETNCHSACMIGIRILEYRCKFFNTQVKETK